MKLNIKQVLKRSILPYYAQDEKYHILKVNLKVPLIMDIDRDAQVTRTFLRVVNGLKYQDLASQNPDMITPP